MKKVGKQNPSGGFYQLSIEVDFRDLCTSAKNEPD